MTSLNMKIGLVSNLIRLPFSCATGLEGQSAECVVIDHDFCTEITCTYGSTWFVALFRISHVTRKPVFGSLQSGKTNRPAQLQRLDIGLKFPIQKLEIFYYLGSEQQRC